VTVPEIDVPLHLARAFLRDVFARIVDDPTNRINEFIAANCTSRPL
jgi:hypothetical protein